MQSWSNVFLEREWYWRVCNAMWSAGLGEVTGILLLSSSINGSALVHAVALWEWNLTFRFRMELMIYVFLHPPASNMVTYKVFQTYQRQIFLKVIKCLKLQVGGYNPVLKYIFACSGTQITLRSHAMETMPSVCSWGCPDPHSAPCLIADRFLLWFTEVTLLKMDQITLSFGHLGSCFQPWASMLAKNTVLH